MNFALPNAGRAALASKKHSDFTPLSSPPSPLSELLKSKVPEEPMLVPHEEPAIAERLTRLLLQARDRKLDPQELLYISPEFFPEGAERMATKLATGNSAERVHLTERVELGDDVIYRYEVIWGGQKLIVRLGLSPDGKISVFAVKN